MLHKRAERVAYVIQDKLKLNHGDHVALLYTPGELGVVLFTSLLSLDTVKVSTCVFTTPPPLPLPQAWTSLLPSMPACLWVWSR